MVTKIAVILDQKTVANLDRWVREGRYPNRSRALQSAVDMLSVREKRSRLARELAELNPAATVRSEPILVLTRYNVFVPPKKLSYEVGLVRCRGVVLRIVAVSSG
jgi:Arc/MetJ-type ribon-helix-helix transcriptional regulator